MAEPDVQPAPRDSIVPFAISMFAIALVVYAIFYSADQNLRTKDGGWQLTFTTNKTGTPMLLINLPSQTITNAAVIFEGETLPANFKPTTTNFIDPPPFQEDPP